MENYVQTPVQMGQVLKARRNLLILTQEKAGRTVGLLPKTISALEITPKGSYISSLRTGAALCCYSEYINLFSRPDITPYPTSSQPLQS